jgi:hypothetical protein
MDKKKNKAGEALKWLTNTEANFPLTDNLYDSRSEFDVLQEEVKLLRMAVAKLISEMDELKRAYKREEKN